MLNILFIWIFVLTTKVQSQNTATTTFEPASPHDVFDLSTAATVAILANFSASTATTSSPSEHGEGEDTRIPLYLSAYFTSVAVGTEVEFFQL